MNFQETIIWTNRYHISRGSIPAKVEYWEGLRIFSYEPTPTKLTNAISKTQLSGPKKGRFLPKIPQMCPFFCFWRVLAFLAVLSPLSELYIIFFVINALARREKVTTIFWKIEFDPFLDKISLNWIFFSVFCVY